jgi:DNA-binding transcriptional LysR family regulator
MQWPLRCFNRCCGCSVSAPRGTSLRMQTLDRLITEGGLERGGTDLLIGIPPALPPGHEAELVYRDDMECIVRRDHPTVRTRLSLAAFAALAHVDLALFDRVDDTLDRALARHGKSRVVRVALPHFSSVPLAVLETDCVATLSSRLARAFASRLPLRVLKLPVALDPIEVRQVWHRRSEGDGAVQFLRTIVRDAARLSEPRERGRRSTPHPRSGR